MTNNGGPLTTLTSVIATILRRALILPSHRLVGLPAVEVYHITGRNLTQPLHNTDIYLPIVRIQLAKTSTGIRKA